MAQKPRQPSPREENLKRSRLKLYAPFLRVQKRTTHRDKIPILIVFHANIIQMKRQLCNFLDWRKKETARETVGRIVMKENCSHKNVEEGLN